MSNVQWNAHVHMDGANAKWIGLGWGIPDDNPGDPSDYFAEITVTAPAEANATVGKVGINESVALKSSLAPCGDGGIAIDVTFRVRCIRGTGQRVEINIAENAGQKASPTGAVLANAKGPIGEDITVPVVVPGSCGSAGTRGAA